MIYGTAYWDILPTSLLNCRLSIQLDLRFEVEKLNGKKFSEHQKCPSCMIGKSQLNDKPESIKRAEKPLAKVNFDLISSSVTSIEG